MPPGEDADVSAETRRRITVFLRQAFRGPVEPATVDRYTAYALGKLKEDLSYTDTMKKVASAALSSPLFLYHCQPEEPDQRPFALASNLSFSSGPAARCGATRPRRERRTGQAGSAGQNNQAHVG